MEREEMLDTGQGTQSPQSPAEPRNDNPVVIDVPTVDVPSTEIPYLRVSLEVPAGMCLQVDLEAHTPAGRLIGRKSLVFGETSAGSAFPARTRPSLRLAWPRRTISASAQALVTSLPLWLVWLALGLYAFTRLYALPSFPIYFFTDEAIQTVSAADLINNHFKSPTQEFLPTYFENGSQLNLSASVYLQAVPYILFGKSVWVTRGTAVLMTLIAALSMWLIFKKVFKSPYPWLAVIILSTTPVWFLHSRTAFETALATSFYAGFLYYYLMYRSENPRYLYGAVALGALSFYSYSGIRVVLLVTALLLLLSDLKYHWQNWKVILGGLGLAALLALPFIRFLINHPGASTWQMRVLGSYIITNIPLAEKLDIYFGEYLRGLDPLYWYLPNRIDLARHIMLGYGHLLRQTLPLGLLGIGIAIRRFRISAYRTLLIAVFAAPTGEALVQLGATRILVMVIPMAILTALAVQAILEWLHRRIRLPRALLSVVVFALFAGVNIYMLWDSLSNGPRWFTDYGLGGMQYGGQQMFAEVVQYRQANPDTRIMISPSWANGTDVIARYFLPDNLNYELGSATGVFKQVQPLENTVFVMIPEEFRQIPKSRFSQINVEKTLFYPDGRPGFYFVRLKYVSNIEQIIAKEEEAHRRPQTKFILIDAQPVKATFTALDMGNVQDLFTQNPNTLIRTDGINPMQLAFEFSPQRASKGILLRIGGSATIVNVQVWSPGADTPASFTRTLSESADFRDVQFDFQPNLLISRLSIEIKNTDDLADGHVHLWKLELLK